MLRYCFVLFVICCPGVRGLFAAGEREYARIKLDRLVPQRPMIKAPIGLSQRDGLTKFERQMLTPLISASEEKSIERVAREFWQAPILKALAELYQSDEAEDLEQSDEWISIAASGSPLFELAEYEASYEPIARATEPVFLSQAGFQRIESSEELIAASGRDELAGTPVADFCEYSPGRDVPNDFSAGFSPWDFGARLASSSRLESTLMDLALQPDIFDGSDPGRFGSTSDRDADDDDFSDDEHGWSQILTRFKDQISARQLSLADFVAKIRNDKLIDQPLRRFVVSAAVTAVELKKSCGLRGGLWLEMLYDGTHDLELFVCRSQTGEVIGPRLSVENGDLEDGTIEFSHRAGPIEFVSDLAAGSSSLRVSMRKSGKPIGSEYLFNSGGRARAVRQFSDPKAAWIFFNTKGQVEFAQTVANTKSYQDIRFYDDGSLREYHHTDESGAIDYVASFYDSGYPMLYVPVRQGKPDGTVYWWHSSGQLAGELQYVSGQRFGLGRLFYQNGIEGFRADYAEGQPHGRLIWRGPDGNAVFSLGYVGGKANGMMEIKNGGRLIGEARFEGGIVEGTITMRNSRGAIVAAIPYKGGLLNGEVVFKDANGVVRAKSQWLDGQMHGSTEAFYSSGAVASRCRFTEGQLLDWESKRPDATPRYQGRVRDSSMGVADLDFFGGTSSSRLKCRTKEWNVEQCSTSGKNAIAAPELNALMVKIVDPGQLVFKPQRCGGFIRAMDVSNLVDSTKGQVSITYRVKELCRGEDLAVAMKCLVDFTGKQWQTKTCVLDETN